jgi:hypothetical protein
VGDLKSFALRPGKMNPDEWTTWLLTEEFARKRVEFGKWPRGEVIRQQWSVTDFYRRLLNYRV